MNASPSSAPSVRTLTQEELVAGSRLAATGMLGDIGDEASAGRAATFEPARTHGAFTPQGALARLDALLRTPTAPWSPTTY